MPTALASAIRWMCAEYCQQQEVSVCQAKLHRTASCDGEAASSVAVMRTLRSVAELNGGLSIAELRQGFTTARDALLGPYALQSFMAIAHLPTSRPVAVHQQASLVDYVLERSSRALQRQRLQISHTESEQLCGGSWRTTLCDVAVADRPSPLGSTVQTVFDSWVADAISDGRQATDDRAPRPNIAAT